MTLNNDSPENNLDSLAKTLFIFLIFFSFGNDFYNMYNNLLENKIVKNNINYFKDLSDAVIGILSNKEKKIKKGVIIEDLSKENNTKIKNTKKKGIFNNTLMDEIKNK
tara:strand:+ start:321 stop:644 length:324 start_codon:yes stop_codon:yes gene_type:complete